MRQVARTFELSVAAHSQATEEDAGRLRRKAIEAQPDSSKRLMSRGIDTMAEKFPRSAKTALNGLVRVTAGYSYLGNGLHASVYRKRDRVAKVYRGTIPMTDQERDIFVYDYGRTSNRMCELLGDIAVMQSLKNREHPLGAYRAVVADQPYVPGFTLPIFVPNTTELNVGAVDDFCNRPGGEEQIKGLVRAACHTHETLGVVPDVNGYGNLRVASGGEPRLRLVDVDPVESSAHNGLVVQQMDVLARYCNE